MTDIKMKFYRPFITENFFWDFPTHFNLKKVSEFLGLEIDPTTQYISDSAKTIMRNDGVYWLIQKKHSDDIVALISLSDLDLVKKQAALMITFKGLNDDEKHEISQRLLVFLKDQISLEEIEINQLDHIVQENFTNNGYTVNNNNLLKRS
ncbi:hypothetical protein FD29_GL000294 [Companilactobacillus mindensis DSM 14500]|uniref:Uncharacterized protein n=1 Tax=Companilactobacillus mindensis DSM 14500 TaxID=1423770 RepID=A0A0R1QHP1_9LACO|nr:hypothetical protein [Companilactobacillus mindensis]KRL44065.1 hypothetical protein FD29_GL000294 [Companilactobacillus mindensis DSM 14500]GEO78918.1 hypothetical protein LMI01_12490 [Companilactobacillus mindensis]